MSDDDWADLKSNSTFNTSNNNSSARQWTTRGDSSNNRHNSNGNGFKSNYGGGGGQNNYHRGGYNNNRGGNFQGGGHYGGRNRSRSPDRSHRASRSPQNRRFNRNDRNISEDQPKKNDSENTNQNDSLLNPIVASAFQKLITNATIGIGTSDREMMTFKQFIFQSDENFDEETAVERYNEYKKKFKLDHLNKFFEDHKSFDWFRNMYDSQLHENEMKVCQEAIKKRFETFMYLYNDLNIIKGQSVEISNQAKLNEILDSAAIMIEGGSIEQLAELNQNERSPKVNENGGEQMAVENSEGGAIWSQFVSNEKSEDIANAKNTEESMADDEPKSEMIVDEPTKAPSATENGEIKNSFHKTSSIYIRELPESISHSELEEFAKNCAGFRRIYVQAPLPVKKWNSRAWIVFENGVDINQICADLCKHTFSNGMSLLGQVSKDIQFRIRPVPGVSNHKELMLNDLKNAVKLVLLNDAKWGLYGANSPELCEKPNLNNLKTHSGNPLLKDIASLIVEEADYEEEMTIEESAAKKSSEVLDNPYKTNMPLINFVSDEKLKSAMDPILLYLRIVHSIDFYSATHIPYESKGPHVLGLFHSRADFVREHINKKDFDEYSKSQSSKIAYVLKCDPYLEQKDIDYATFKDFDQSISEYIAANSKEIAADKWKCLICEKKFKDSPFLVKHIKNKHTDLLEKVHDECQLFNNYLKDPQRPGIFIHGVGKLTDLSKKNETAANNIDAAKSNTVYNNAVSSLSSNPVLMATFINQAIASANVDKVPNAAAMGSGHRFNQMQERRSITSYTDVDFQN